VPYAGEVDVAPPLTTGPDIVYSPSHIHVDGDVRAGWFFGFVDDLASWSCFGFLHNLDRFPMVVSREAAGTLGIKGGDSDNGEGSVLVRALSFKKDGDATTINVNILDFKRTCL
jgi:hypothetical protein